MIGDPIVLNDVILTPDFDLLASASLIEASAGTGKTHCLQTLYLRFVIELGLRVENILVVTFTEAATKELRDRLRRILTKCQTYFEGTLSSNDDDYDRIAAIASFIPLNARRLDDDAAERVLRVRRSLLEFDQAAIQTIHGFCSRILKRFAFECRHDFRTEIVAGRDEIMDAVCEDWWRRNLYGSPPTSAGVAVLNSFGNLKTLKELCRKHAAKPDAAFTVDPGAGTSDDLKDSLQELRDLWNEAEIRDQLETAKFRANVLGGGKIDAFIAEMNDFVSGRRSALPAAIDEFSTNKLHKDGARINKSPGPPKHPFFDACETLAHFTWGAIPEAVKEINAEFIKRKSALRNISFDDMLLDLRAALRRDADGSLIRALRDEFKAGLIDEFQDTDPIQYEIFRRLFIESPDHPVFLVGDPKQAIYSFRNGDIFTYYAAKRTVETTAGRIYDLNKNYRSEENMIHGVNHLFADREGDRTFQNDAIDYPGTLKAAGKSPEKSLKIAGEIDPNPMKVWFHPDKSLKLPRVYATVADEIVALLNDDDITIGDRHLLPSDVAILVNRHAEATELRAELSKRGVPAVRQNSESIFKSREAREMLLVMKALCFPTHVRAVKSALATTIMPPTNEELTGADPSSGEVDDSGVLGEWMAWFQEAKRRWERGSFARTFLHLLKETGMRAALLGKSGGERRLTNVTQLIDLIHHAALEGNFGLEQTRLWLKRKIDGIDADKDEYETRLESDDEAVKIMTVFKSKGLQFSIVFVPTLYLRHAELRKDETFITYHDPASTEDPPPLIFEVPVSPEGQKKAEDEKLQEDVRLVYVALTRAVNRCYVLAAPGPNKPSAMRCLLSRINESGDGVAWRKGFPEARRDERYRPRDFEPALLESPESIGAIRVNTDQRHASFTALSPEHGTATVELYDYDETPESNGTANLDDEPRDLDIFSFPGGAKTGNCWHAIFERLDFTAFSERANEEERLKARRVIDDQLELYKIHQLANPDDDERARELVHEMVETTLSSPLDENGTIRLNHIGDGDKIAEMEFNFPLSEHPATMGDLYDVLENHWRDDPTKTLFLRNTRNRERNKPIPAGFMTGFMDLVFRHQGKYHILDWKSNRRDGLRRSFDQAGLTEEMADNFYFLQYLLYTVALRRHLSETIPNFSYDRHFGGVFYVFPRGVETDKPGSGVYADRPDEALVADLAALLEGES